MGLAGSERPVYSSGMKAAPRKKRSAQSKPAGYSGTPLPQKLGIKPGHRVALLGPPPEFQRTLGKLPAGVVTVNGLEGDPFDVVLLFVVEKEHLDLAFSATARHLKPNGGLWVSWPKKVSGVPTDLTEDRVREVALAAGLVDNKVCAIDETWSGLRFVRRVAKK